MRTKICGITNYDDAMLAIDAGADALGFVFYKKSPRYITPADAARIIKKLPPFIEKVALFVNETAEDINKISAHIGATLAQIHFSVSGAFLEELKIPYIRVVRAQNRDDLHLYSDAYRLVDAYSEAYGGSGKRLALEWFEGIDCSKIILAGGLSPQNVSQIKEYGFYGVDVSSGVELSPGRKDSQKVKDFIQNAK